MTRHRRSLLVVAVFASLCCFELAGATNRVDVLHSSTPTIAADVRARVVALDFAIARGLAKLSASTNSPPDKLWKSAEYIQAYAQHLRKMVVDLKVLFDGHPDAAQQYPELRASVDRAMLQMTLQSTANSPASEISTPDELRSQILLLKQSLTTNQSVRSLLR